jgi:GNAT superfamily N-acetyltransferase
MRPAPESIAGRLAQLLRDAAFGTYPESDLETEVLAKPVGATAAVVAFGGHMVVAADVPSEWVESQCPPGDLMAAVRPEFLVALSVRCGCTDFSTTMTFALPGLGGDRDAMLVPVANHVSVRVRRSHRVRTEVSVYETADGNGLLVVGRGLAGRWEAGFEVQPRARGRGLGRRLANAARSLVPTSEPLFMQAVPGNIASIRALIGAGFRPVTSEVLLWRSG